MQKILGYTLLFTLLINFNSGPILLAHATNRPYYEIPHIFDKGFLVSDLDMKFYKSLDTQVDLWEFRTNRTASSNLFESKIASCDGGDAHFVGGPNIFGADDIATRTYINLTPVASWLAFSIKLHAINFGANDKVVVKVANKIYTIRVPTTVVAVPIGYGSRCSNYNAAEYYQVTVNGQIDYFGGPVTISIESFIEKPITQAGLGFSDIQILPKLNPSAYFGGAYQLCPFNQCPRNNNNNPETATGYCYQGHYWNLHTQSCEACMEGCLACHLTTTSPGALNLQCTSCKPETQSDGAQSCKPVVGMTNVYRFFSENQGANFPSSVGAPRNLCYPGFLWDHLTHTCQQETSCTLIKVGLEPNWYECRDECRNQTPYLAWNFTCIDSCPPLQRRISGAAAENNRLYCDYPCLDKRDFLYFNGSCLRTCPPSLIKTLQPYGSYRYCDDDGLQEPSSLTTVINGKNTSLFFYTKWANPHQEIFSIDQIKFHLDATWSFFGLERQNASIYSIQNWDSSFHCGCQPQRCGDQCDHTYYCQTARIEDDGSAHNDTEDGRSLGCILNPWKPKRHFCWDLRNEGSQEFKAYPLKLISVISWFSFGGDGIQDLVVDTSSSTASTSSAFALIPTNGFTISNAVNNQTFASNGLIKDYVTKDLKGDMLVFATSENRVLMKKELEVFKKIPSIQADYTTASCNGSDGTLHRRISYTQKINERNAIMTAYQILHKPKIDKFSSLDKVHILTPTHGIQEWRANYHRDHPFIFIDPCNQQFLALQVSKEGAFSVKPPGHQKLIVENIICIAVNLDPKDSRNLALYEVTIGDSIWKASSRFTGILSKDFIERLQVKITTRASPSLKSEDDDDDIIHVEISENINPPRILLRTHAPMICDIHLSPNCSLRFVTTAEQRTVFEDIEQNCGYWYERITCQCDGFVGYVYPPNSLVKAPIKDYQLEREFFFEGSQMFPEFSSSTDDRISVWTLFLLLSFLATPFLAILWIYSALKARKKITKRNISSTEMKDLMKKNSPEDKEIYETEENRLSTENISYLTPSMFK